MTKAVCTICLLLGISWTPFANSTSLIKPNDAQTAIERLEGGFLLIRLKTKSKSIAAYREAGNEKLANRIDKEQKALNQDIIEAFANWDFCPVYFIDLEDYKSDEDWWSKIRNGQGETIQNISKDASFLILDHGPYQPKNESGVTMVDDALVLKFDDLSNIPDPFPQFIKFPYRTNQLGKVVTKLNNRIRKFAEKNRDD